MDRLSPGRRSSIEREFQALGHETAKARGPIVLVLQEGTKSSPVAAERSLDRPDIVETGTHSFDRYCGAVPFTQRYANTHIRTVYNDVISFCSYHHASSEHCNYKSVLCTFGENK